MIVTVWVIESGEYEQRGVEGVVASLDGALAKIGGNAKPHQNIQPIPGERWVTIGRDDPRWSEDRMVDLAPDYTLTPYDVEIAVSDVS